VEIMTVTEYLRKRLADYTNGSVVGDKTESLEELRESEWSPLFEKLMRNRLLMGRFRYGKMNDPAKGNYDCVQAIARRLDLYVKTGNLEYLVDVSNFALVEFVHSRHPNKHFSSQDDGEHARPLEKP
jgi:hypothetical protein